VIKQAHIGMTFPDRMSVAVANFGGWGKRKCHIPHLPLTLGQHRVAAAVTCGPELADLITNALLLKTPVPLFSGRARRRIHTMLPA